MSGVGSILSREYLAAYLSDTRVGIRAMDLLVCCRIHEQKQHTCNMLSLYLIKALMWVTMEVRDKLYWWLFCFVFHRPGCLQFCMVDEYFKVKLYMKIQN